MSFDKSVFGLGSLNLLFYPLIFEKDLQFRFDTEFDNWVNAFKLKNNVTDQQIYEYLQQVLLTSGWKNTLATTKDMTQSEEELNKLIQVASSKLIDTKII